MAVVLRLMRNNAFVLFLVALLAVPVVKAASVEGLGDKCFLGSLALCFFVWAGVRSKRILTEFEEFKCKWYLINGIFFHLLFDFGVGVLHVFEMMDKEYKILDGRFAVDHAVSSVIGCVEGFIMFPLCLLAFWALKKDKKWASEVEIVLGTAQVFGAIVFVFTEVWDGQPHLHYGNGVLQNLVYYWFAFWVCNFIWIVFPSYVVYDAARKSIKQKMN